MAAARSIFVTAAELVEGAAEWGTDIVDQLEARGPTRCASVWRPLLEPYGAAATPGARQRKRKRSAGCEEAAIVENEPGLCAAIGRAHDALRRAGARAIARAQPCSCGEPPPDGGLDLLRCAAAAPAGARAIRELRVGDDDREEEVGERLLACRLITNASPRVCRLRFSGQPWRMPPRSSALCADLREWDAPLRAARPSGGFELVVVDPPWPSHSAHRAGAYETQRDVLDLLPSRVRLAPLLNTALGALVCVWVTNNKAYSDFVVDTLFPSWGVRHVATWFWLKLTAQTGELATGALDSAHRKPWEPLLLGVAGESRWAARLPARHVLCAAPVGHSVKPPLEAVLRKHAPDRDFASGAKLELFARELHPGWCSFGDQALLFQSDAWVCGHHRDERLGAEGGRARADDVGASGDDGGHV